MYNPLAPDWKSNRDLMRIKVARVETVDEPGDYEIAILHGWHSLYTPLLGVENDLRRRFPRARIWRVNYDSHWKTFDRSAREVSYMLRRRGVVPSKTLLIGYSMGGVVSRAMVANGFDARAVLTLCSPHHGPAPWITFGDIGSHSISRWSNRLARLNNHPRDIARRDDYYFHAFTFTDRSGFCRHDRIVSWRSAIGVSVPGVGERHTVDLKYPGYAPDCDPHLQGMNPKFLGRAFDWAAEKMSPATEVAA